MDAKTNELLEILQKVLLRCWQCGIGMLLVTFLVILLLGGTVFQVHQWLFGLTRHEFDLILYCAMGLWKLCILTCFFLPWLSIKLVRKSMSNANIS